MSTTGGTRAVFPPTVADYWAGLFPDAEPAVRTPGFALTVDAALPDNRRVMVFDADADDLVRAAVTPAVADRLALAPDATEADFRAALAAAGITLNGADHLFYFTEAGLAALLAEEPAAHVRRLGADDADDAEAFAAFQGAAGSQDLDDAQVELDDWAVFGAFDAGRLVCAASVYPWGGDRFADTGVLTLAGFRGRGHARAVVRAICRYAAGEGYPPQYRCQLDNAGSVALAAACGLAHFGTWDVVSAA